VQLYRSTSEQVKAKMKNLIEMLKRHEGVRSTVYVCSAGYETIGVGRNISATGLGLSEDEVDYLLQNDIERVIKELSAEYRWFNSLDDVRKDAMIDISFNLGATRLRGFKRALAAMEVADYTTAAKEFLDSKWSRDVKGRATELCYMIETGELPIMRLEMPLQKLQFKPGVDRENTRYAAEGGWYETNKVRFRRGMPQKIGGWVRLSSATFLGICRSMLNWVTLQGQNLVSVGTNLKYYIERGGAYFDITPIRSTVTLTNPFDTTSGSAVVLVTDTAHGALEGDFVTFSGATAVGGLTLNNEYQISLIDEDSYNITAETTASSTANGGGTVTATYQINTGNEIAVPFTGWSGGTWGAGTWGFGGTTNSPIRLWSQANFGEDLFFTYRGGELFYWDASNGVTTRAVYVSSLAGASDVPVIVNKAFVSDIFRFAFCFGANDLGTSVLDPMLIRWSDQEDVANWTPAATNQAGSLRLSRGSEIITAIQARQEILVWTDTALYGMQYLGAPEVWGAQLLGDNITIASPNAAVYSGNIAYWMGTDKFYYYDGTVKTLPCSIRSYIFNDFNSSQYDQVIAGTNERFDEIWWFYCSADVTQNDRYVVYNYLQDIWYYGTLSRSAWIDADLRENPMAATYSNNLVTHEVGYDCQETATPFPITATLVSSEFDLDDGDKFMFVKRMLPDVTFEGSTADSPAATMTLSPMENSGSGYNNPLSEGGNSSATVTRSATVPIEQFTGQVFVRVRGRQMAFKIESTELGVAWKLGIPRLDMRPDGKRG
jgi:GH24 family phage-related lysozyme (muramidase)